MDDFGLYAILTNSKAGPRRFTEICVEEEVAFLQIREKYLSDREIIELVSILAEITKGSKTRLILNDRADLAGLLDIDGVHLGQDDLPPGYAGRFLKKGQITGLSTHSLGQVLQAMEYAPDYIGFGPVYKTPAKAIPDPPVGTGDIKTVLDTASCPVVCIGGLFPDNLEPVLDAGARNIACVRYLMDVYDPRSRILELKNMLAGRSVYDPV